MTCVSAVGKLLGWYTDIRKGVEANVLLSKIIEIYSNVVFKIKQNHLTLLSSLPQKKKKAKGKKIQPHPFPPQPPTAKFVKQICAMKYSAVREEEVDLSFYSCC